MSVVFIANPCFCTLPIRLKVISGRLPSIRSLIKELLRINFSSSFDLSSLRQTRTADLYIISVAL